MSELRFTGRERVTIELDGQFDPAAVALPHGLAHDGGRVSLFAFQVERLRIEGLPLVSFTYGELLWRIAAVHEGAPCWWVIACDLGARAPGWAARRYIRYPVRPNAVTVDETRLISRGRQGTLALEVSNKIAPPLALEHRPLRTGADAGWLVPWDDDLGTSLTHPIKLVEDTLSRPTLGVAVSWANGAVLRRGRTHRCGVAHR